MRMIISKVSPGRVIILIPPYLPENFIFRQPSSVWRLSRVIPQTLIASK